MKKTLLFLLFSIFAVQTQVGVQAKAQAKVQAQTQMHAQAPAQETPQETPQGPHFAFGQTEYDFGEVPHKTKQIEHRFEFTNDGTEPLVITRTMVSCSCVKVSYDKKPVPPGEKGEIVVVYEVSKKEAGVFRKVVDVYSNSVERRISLIVKGNAVE